MIAIGQTGLPKSGILVELTPGEYEALYHLATAVAGLPGTTLMDTDDEPPQIDLAPALELLRDFAELRYILNDLQHQASLIDQWLTGVQPKKTPRGEVLTDCRTETGTTVGLIDTIITAARVLGCRNLSAPEVTEALLDLQNDEDVAHLLKREVDMNVSGKAFTNKDKLIVKLVLTADGSTIGFGPEVDVSISNNLGTTGINEKLRPAAKPGEVPRRPKPNVGSVSDPDRRRQHQSDPRPKKPL